MGLLLSAHHSAVGLPSQWCSFQREGQDAYYYYKLLLKSYPARASRPIDVSQIDWNKDILTSHVLVLEINESDFAGEYLSAFLSDILRQLRADPHD
jgi:hypothetical protein